MSLHCLLLQESGLKVNQPASFAVRLNGAQGVIDAKVHSPSGALEDCVVSELEQGKTQIGARRQNIKKSSESLTCTVFLYLKKKKALTA